MLGAIIWVHVKIYQYIIRRVLMWPLVLFGVVTLTFIVLQATPIDPIRTRLAIRGMGMDPLYIETMNRIYGLDRPVPEQYVRYIGNVLRGDLGVSFDNPGTTVSAILIKRLPATMELTLMALIFALGIGIPLGIVSALHRNKLPDHIARTLSLGGVAMPSFWLGLILLIVFFYHLRIFPSSGRLGFIQSPPPHVTGLYTIDSLLSGRLDLFWSSVQHLILPAFTLSIGPIAMLARLTRSGMLETLSKDYIRLAKSMGLSQRRIHYRLALKNTLIPTVTYLGLAVGSMLGGTVIIETVFGWPGLGHFGVNSLMSKDLYSVMGVVLMMALIFSIASLIVDLIYGILDPRIRYG